MKAELLRWAVQQSLEWHDMRYRTCLAIMTTELISRPLVDHVKKVPYLLLDRISEESGLLNLLQTGNYRQVERILLGNDMQLLESYEAVALIPAVVLKTGHFQAASLIRALPWKYFQQYQQLEMQGILRGQLERTLQLRLEHQIPGGVMEECEVGPQYWEDEGNLSFIAVELEKRMLLLLGDELSPLVTGVISAVQSGEVEVAICPQTEAKLEEVGEMLLQERYSGIRRAISELDYRKVLSQITPARLARSTKLATAAIEILKWYSLFLTPYYTSLSGINSIDEGTTLREIMLESHMLIESEILQGEMWEKCEIVSHMNHFINSQNYIELFSRLVSRMGLQQMKSVVVLLILHIANNNSRDEESATEDAQIPEDEILEMITLRMLPTLYPHLQSVLSANGSQLFPAIKASMERGSMPYICEGKVYQMLEELLLELRVR